MGNRNTEPDSKFFRTGTEIHNRPRNFLDPEPKFGTRPGTEIQNRTRNFLDPEPNSRTGLEIFWTGTRNTEPNPKFFGPGTEIWYRNRSESVPKLYVQNVFVFLKNNFLDKLKIYKFTIFYAKLCNILKWSTPRDFRLTNAAATLFIYLCFIWSFIWRLFRGACCRLLFYCMKKNFFWIYILNLKEIYQDKCM